MHLNGKRDRVDIHSLRQAGGWGLLPPKGRGIPRDRASRSDGEGNRAPRSPVAHIRGVSGNEVLDVDEGILSSVDLEEVEQLENAIAEACLMTLRIIDTVPEIPLLEQEDVEDGKDGPVVRHQGPTHSTPVRAVNSCIGQDHVPQGIHGPQEHRLAPGV